jgi:hypothetical protein
MKSGILVILSLVSISTAFAAQNNIRALKQSAAYLAQFREYNTSSDNTISNPDDSIWITNENLALSIADTKSDYSQLVSGINQNNIESSDKATLNQAYTDYMSALDATYNSFTRVCMAASGIDTAAATAHRQVRVEGRSELAAFAEYFAKGFPQAPGAVIGLVLTLPQGFYDSFIRLHLAKAKLDKSINETLAKI